MSCFGEGCTSPLQTNEFCSESTFLSTICKSNKVSLGNGTPLQYSCLENPMDRGAWWAAVHGVAKSRTRLSDFTFIFHFHALEKEMATHSSVLHKHEQTAEALVFLPRFLCIFSGRLRAFYEI